MVTLGDLIRYRSINQPSLILVGEVVGKRRDKGTGERIYDVYGLEHVPDSPDVYKYAREPYAVPVARVISRVKNRGNYQEAWEHMGWNQVGNGEKSRFTPIIAETVPKWDLVLSDSDDMSTDDSTDTDSDTLHQGYASSSSDSDYEPSIEETSETETSTTIDSDSENEETSSPELARLRDEANQNFQAWKPQSKGESRFKSVIARIEERVRNASIARRKKTA